MKTTEPHPGMKSHHLIQTCTNKEFLTLLARNHLRQCPWNLNLKAAQNQPRPLGRSSGRRVSTRYNALNLSHSDYTTGSEAPYEH
ncbi:unnamed protein product [Allacma fusca]|uniref:Uncharacterized protein n=1 Tax=Allacma fusca TaxID=39272 RepID=A0A8J2P6Z8_9HEXA|nr:unnamed protein product [Allacma fusca]